jgi:hypothetical protein
MERPSHVQRPPGVKTRPQQAERREPQERQRAAKASPNNVTDKYRKPSEAKHSSKPKSVSHISTKDSASVVSTDADHVLRHLRIFSHFVPSGKSPASNNHKVEIHPAILRLALQFSEFRIVGGNARCIATVEALKEVRCLSTSSEYRPHCLVGDTQLLYSSPQFFAPSYYDLHITANIPHPGGAASICGGGQCHSIPQIRDNFTGVYGR